MRAVLCKEFGPPSLLVVEDIASPVAGVGEVVVQVKATALNFFDTLIIKNMYQTKPPMPFSPGAEIAGVISHVGPKVSGFETGDRVMAYMSWGGCQEEVAVAADRLVKIPNQMEYKIAAGLTVTYGTTYHALKDRADLQPGETLAVLGASGGVGQSAIEIGKAMGARVIAAASSADKLEFCRSIGADELVNYNTENLKDRLKELTRNNGVDVVYDPVGADYSEQALRAIAWQGRFLVVGFAAGEIPKIPLNLALLKGCQIVGVFWGAFIKRNPKDHQANTAQIMQWVLSGKLKPHIHQEYTLEQTVDALEALANREVKGKAIIIPDT